jgi:hypothetical protein
MYNQYYNQNKGRQRQQIGFGGLGPIISAAAAGIGLASEGIQHHKEKKAAKKAAAAQQEQSGPSQPPPAYEANGQHSQKSEKAERHHQGDGHHGDERQLEEGDEEQWDLDDAQDEVAIKASVPKERPFERDPKLIIQHFLDDYPLPQGYVQRGINLPVVLPQRRPKDRTRGFIRAYAPELESCGIDQAMFLDFLQTFSLASAASPWLNAINLAGLAFNAIPIPGVGFAAGMALMMVVNVVKNMQARDRYDHYL